MKTFIIGAKGMLGSMLMDVLKDWKPVGLDKEDIDPVRGRPPVDGGTATAAWGRPASNGIDITNLDNVREKIRSLEPDVIINAAAYTDVDGAETHPKEAFAVNEQGIRNVAIVAKEIDAIVVHYSTDYVFDGRRQDGYSEDDPPGPAVNVYGESKLAGERALVEAGPRFYLQRIAWLYGPHGGNFVDTMLTLAKTHDQLSVVADQFGCPTYTKDVALATRSLLTEGYEPGIYHTPNSGVASWFDFASKIFQLTHTRVDVKRIPGSEYPTPAARPQYSVLRNTRGPAMRPWEKALAEYLTTYYNSA